MRRPSRIGLAGGARRPGPGRGRRPRPAEEGGALREGRLLRRVPRRRGQGAEGARTPPWPRGTAPRATSPTAWWARCGSRRTSRSCASTATTAPTLGLEAAHRHPEVENCSRCHDPHGSDHAAILKSPERELCTSCHSGGGFAGRVVHAPVGESCLTCHRPHGAAEPALLASRARPCAPPATTARTGSPRATGGSRWPARSARPATRPTPRPARSCCGPRSTPSSSAAAATTRAAPIAAPGRRSRRVPRLPRDARGRQGKPAPAGGRGGVPDLPRPPHHRPRPAAGRAPRRRCASSATTTSAKALAGEPPPRTPPRSARAATRGTARSRPTLLKADSRALCVELPRGPGEEAGRRRSSTRRPPTTASTATQPHGTGRKALLTAPQGDLCASLPRRHRGPLGPAGAPRPGGPGRRAPPATSPTPGAAKLLRARAGRCAPAATTACSRPRRAVPQHEPFEAGECDTCHLPHARGDAEAPAGARRAPCAGAATTSRKRPPAGGSLHAPARDALHRLPPAPRQRHRPLPAGPGAAPLRHLPQGDRGAAREGDGPPAGRGGRRLPRPATRPHAAGEPHLLRASVSKTCLGCHDGAAPSSRRSTSASRPRA